MKGSVIFLRWRCVRRLSMGADIRRMRDRIRNRDSGQRRRDAGRHGGLVQPDSGHRGHHDAGLSQPVTPLVVVEGDSSFPRSRWITATRSTAAAVGTACHSMPSTASRRAPNPNVDARLARTLAFTQRIKGTVGFEAFNLLNRQQSTRSRITRSRRFRLA